MFGLLNGALLTVGSKDRDCCWRGGDASFLPAFWVAGGDWTEEEDGETSSFLGGSPTETVR